MRALALLTFRRLGIAVKKILLYEMPAICARPVATRVCLDWAAHPLIQSSLARCLVCELGVKRSGEEEREKRQEVAREGDCNQLGW